MFGTYYLKKPGKLDHSANSGNIQIWSLSNLRKHIKQQQQEFIKRFLHMPQSADEMRQRRKRKQTLLISNKILKQMRFQTALKMGYGGRIFYMLRKSTISYLSKIDFAALFLRLCLLYFVIHLHGYIWM